MSETDKLPDGQCVAAAEFLQLPGEIRLEVYKAMSPPLTAHMSEYKGFYLSCRQIKNEMDHEVLRSMKQYLEKEDGPPSSRFNIQVLPLRPPNECAAFRNITNLRLSYTLNEEAIRNVSGDDFFELSCVVPLKLQSLTFVATIPSEALWRDPREQDPTFPAVVNSDWSDNFTDILDGVFKGLKMGRCPMRTPWPLNFAVATVGVGVGVSGSNKLSRSMN